MIYLTFVDHLVSNNISNYDLGIIIFMKVMFPKLSNMKILDIVRSNNIQSIKNSIIIEKMLNR